MCLYIIYVTKISINIKVVALKQRSKSVIASSFSDVLIFDVTIAMFGKTFSDYSDLL